MQSTELPKDKAIQRIKRNKCTACAAEVLLKIIYFFIILLTVALILFTVINYADSPIVGQIKKILPITDFTNNIHHFLKFCSDDFSVLQDFSIVIWTFSVTLIIFYLERTESQIYGTTISQLTTEILSSKFLFLLLCSLISHIVIMLFAIINQDDVLSFFCTIMHFSMMVYIFGAICLLNSKSYIFYKIISEFQQRKVFFKWLKKSKVSFKRRKKNLIYFFNMLRATDYTNESQVHDMDILLKIISDSLLSSNIESDQSNFTYTMFNYIFSLNIDTKIKEKIVQHYLSEFTQIPLQCGIMKSLLTNVYHNPDLQIENIIDSDFNNRSEVVMWGFVYNLYLISISYTHMEYNLLLDKIFRKNILTHTGTLDVMEAIKLWKNIYKNEQGTHTLSSVDFKYYKLIYNAMEDFWNVFYQERRF